MYEFQELLSSEIIMQTSREKSALAIFTNESTVYIPKLTQTAIKGSFMAFVSPAAVLYQLIEVTENNKWRC